jgi:hypothetical protein
MKPIFRMAVALSLLSAALGSAQTPTETPAPPEPDARMVYSSDTRAYYRPCG